jgi:hypothetical protein
MSTQTLRGPFDKKTVKLLLLALDPGAAPGEIANAAVGLVRQLRQRYPDGHAFLAELVDKTDNRYGETRMPFGKHRGSRLRDIDPTYLLWVVANTNDPYLKIAIRRFLG